MDSTSGTNAPHHIGLRASPLQYPNTRKRSRGSSEDDVAGGASSAGASAVIISPSSSKEEKRLKARERQRRKRERDRSGRDKSGGPSSSSIVTLSSSSTDLPVGPPGVGIGGVLSPPDEEVSQIMNIYGHHHPLDVIPNVADPNSNPSATSTPNGHGRGGSGGGRGPGPSDTSNVSPEEMAKRDRVRVAARERQRKHRAAVKAKRMAEMGIAIVAPGGVDHPGIHYVLNEHGQYDPIMQDPTTHHHPHQHSHPPPPSHPHGQPPHPHPHFQVLPEPPFPVPQSHMTPGQTFAHTLLLSISCIPALKQQLLRNLHMSEEELGSLEPMIASAWDHWAHDRALHYAAANASVPGSGDHNAPPTSYNIPPHPPGPTSPNPSNQNSTQGPTTAASSSTTQQPPNSHNIYSTDFRERFQRPLVAPFPSNAPITRSMHHSSQPPPNGSSSTTNGSFSSERRDEADSDGRDERDERKRSSPVANANSTTDSIDPNLESESTSHVRTAEPGKNGNSSSSQQQQQKQSEPPSDKKLEVME